MAKLTKKEREREQEEFEQEFAREKAKHQAEKKRKKARNKEQGTRALYILGFAGNVASAVMYAHLIATPDAGHYVLACVNMVTAGYFMYKAVQ